MFDLIFESSKAKILDTISIDPKSGYSAKELSLRCNLDENDVKRDLSGLETYQFVEKRNGKYYLQKK